MSTKKRNRKEKRRQAITLEQQIRDLPPLSEPLAKIISELDSTCAKLEALVFHGPGISHAPPPKLWRFFYRHQSRLERSNLRALNVPLRIQGGSPLPHNLIPPQPPPGKEELQDRIAQAAEVIPNTGDIKASLDLWLSLIQNKQDLSELPIPENFSAICNDEFPHAKGRFNLPGMFSAENYVVFMLSWFFWITVTVPLYLETQKPLTLLYREACKGNIVSLGEILRMDKLALTCDPQLQAIWNRTMTCGPDWKRDRLLEMMGAKPKRALFQVQNFKKQLAVMIRLASAATQDRPIEWNTILQLFDTHEAEKGKFKRPRPRVNKLSKSFRDSAGNAYQYWEKILKTETASSPSGNTNGQAN